MWTPLGTVPVPTKQHWGLASVLGEKHVKLTVVAKRGPWQAVELPLGAGVALDPLEISRRDPFS